MTIFPCARRKRLRDTDHGIQAEGAQEEAGDDDPHLEADQDMQVPMPNDENDQEQDMESPVHESEDEHDIQEEDPPPVVEDIFGDGIEFIAPATLSPSMYKNHLELYPLHYWWTWNPRVNRYTTEWRFRETDPWRQGSVWWPHIDERLVEWYCIEPFDRAREDRHDDDQDPTARGSQDPVDPADHRGEN